MIIELNVTQEHIDAGTPGEGDSCAIAQTILEQFPDAICVDVNTPQISFGIGKLHYCATATDAVSEFICDYDRGSDDFDDDGEQDLIGKILAKPTTFTLDFEVTEEES